MEVKYIVPVNFTALISTGISILVSAIVGLIAWGLRGEIRLIRSHIETQMAEAENRFFQRVNGSYVRKEVYQETAARMDRFENRLEEIE